MDLLPPQHPSSPPQLLSSHLAIFPSLLPPTVQAHGAGWYHWHQGELSAALTCQRCWSWASLCIRVRLDRVPSAQGRRMGKRGIICQPALKPGLFFFFFGGKASFRARCGCGITVVSPMLAHGKSFFAKLPLARDKRKLLKTNPYTKSTDQESFE